MKALVRLSAVVLVAILIGQIESELGAEASESDEFVRTKGVQFVIGKYPYYANGFNAYWLMYQATDPNQRSKVSDLFRDTSKLGLTVARTWAFADGGYRALQVSPGSYDEKTFQGLDFVVAEARRYGIKLILSFVNNYPNLGGRKQYVDWATSRGQSLTSEDDFYTNPLVKDFYKKHVTTVLNRLNTFTKIQYKDDPTIMAWELMNEPRCASDSSGHILQDWITEMAAHVKSIDKNHLLEVGLEGFYGDQSSPERKNLNPPVKVGTDFIANNRVPGIDFVSVHSYPDQWFPNTSKESQLEFLKRWLDAHIEDAQNVLQKPIVLAEFGETFKEPGFTPQKRDMIFSTVFGKVYESAKRGGAAAGGLVWQLLGIGMDDLQDGYGIILSERSSIVNIISQQSRKLGMVRRMFARKINMELWKKARGRIG